MRRILFWLNKRALRDVGMWLSFLILAIAGLFLSGGVTYRNTLTQDISMLNIAYVTNFETKEEFLAWFNLWQFQWLMGAFGQMCLFPIAVRLLPGLDSPELHVPVALGYTRAQLWFAAMLRFCGEAAALSLLCSLFGAIASGIHPAAGVSAGYYLRCFLFHIWRDLGFAGLALLIAMLLPKRVPGICLSFGALTLLAVVATNRLLDETVFRVLLSSMATQYQSWLWQPVLRPVAGEAVLLFVFPFITFGLASGIGLIRFRADLRLGG